MKYVFILNDPPYGTERSYNGLRLANALAKTEGNAVSVTDRASAVQEMARVLRPGGIVVIGELGRYSLWALARRIRGWFGEKFWREAHFWTTDELRRLVELGGLEFGAVRGAVYYPPSRLVAKWLVPLDSLLSRISPVGAAFLCVRADKPSPGSAREGLATSSLQSSS
jgi:SAM-dependent methyltransferase